MNSNQPSENKDVELQQPDDRTLPASANLSGEDVTIAQSRAASPDARPAARPASANSPKKHARPLVIAVANQKGGVAKTTTVVSLGGALARLNQEVLLVDLDAQANLTLALGKDPSRVRGAVTEVLFNSASLLSVSRETSIPGLDLVPANAGMDLAERFLPVRKDYETILRRALRTELRPAAPARGPATATSAPGISAGSPHPPTIHYDFVLLDCPPFLGAVTTNALVAADLLIIPTQPEYFSAHALRTMTTAIRQVRTQHNPDLVYRILITLSDRRNRIHREVGEQIRNTFGEGVFQTVIEVDTKLRESAVEGLPISYHRSQSRSALQYHALAQELMAYV
jgi:chromosome partitioning protein